MSTSYFPQLCLLFYCLHYSIPCADLLSVIQPHIVHQLEGSTSPHKVLIFTSNFVTECYKHPTSQPEFLSFRDSCTKGVFGASHMQGMQSHLPLYFHSLQSVSFPASPLPLPSTAVPKPTQYQGERDHFSTNQHQFFSEYSKIQHRRKSSCRKWTSSVSHLIWSSFTETVDITNLITSQNYNTNPLCSRDETCINSITDVTWIWKCP